MGGSRLGRSYIGLLFEHREVRRSVLQRADGKQIVAINKVRYLGGVESVSPWVVVTGVTFLIAECRSKCENVLVVLGSG